MRYYFDFDYDRDKLEFLGKKSESVLACVNRDLDVFVTYLTELNSADKA